MTPKKFTEVKTPSSKVHSFQLSNSTKFSTPQSIRNRNGTFSTFPVANTPTPPPRSRKIVNPFEAGLVDRLHLPFIGSPSLFHRPATPQMSSTKLDFEWTIEEVSKINPANVEAHETQFHSFVDPEEEAKAQAAISSFFKEQLIAPSPDDCPFREQKIILDGNESFTDCRPASAKTKRDGYCQTVLTLPPILPKEIEDALKPFFTYTQSQQQLPPCDDCDDTVDAISVDHVDCVIDHDARNASLRRQLLQPYPTANDASFTDYAHDVMLDSPTPCTPELDLRNIRSRRFSRTPHGDSDDANKSPHNVSLSPVKRESFGCISPISKVVAVTPHSDKQAANDITIENKSSASSLYRSTPERSIILRTSFTNTSTDGISAQPRVARSNGSHMKRKSFHLSDDQCFSFAYARSLSETKSDAADCSYDDSSYGSQQHPHTPTLNKSKRRRLSVNRKNLSHSFVLCLNEENMSVIEHTGAMTLDARDKTPVNSKAINRTDSGFNEADDLVQPKHMQYNGTDNVIGGNDDAVDVSMTDTSH